MKYHHCSQLGYRMLDTYQKSLRKQELLLFKKQNTIIWSLPVSEWAVRDHGLCWNLKDVRGCPGPAL